eukprot:CAMPEP_0170615738 /NCGR_PEP_ID=MMETSP0224-20130122/25501_1 /TAXON_ID=285029 /ORGANISM="Togula jolla, Strain CCCM 725" /LENGTH=216 /DNA_ID=CAMNT_0010941497 /DNA_START=58 /DNA_END=708 /DNA_ORIENTATION=-
MRCTLALVVMAPLGSAMLHLKGRGEGASCAKVDMTFRAQLQSKLAGRCEDMCRAVDAYPNCNCPDMPDPESTDGVMTWEELLAHMGNVEQQGRDQLKGWHKRASQLQRSTVTAVAQEDQAACAAVTLQHRMELQNKLAGECEEMCNRVGAYPNCDCPGFVAPDATPGVMTWDELLEHMGNLKQWGRGQVKGWLVSANAPPATAPEAPEAAEAPAEE